MKISVHVGLLTLLLLAALLGIVSYVIIGTVGTSVSTKFNTLNTSLTGS